MSYAVNRFGPCELETETAAKASSALLSTKWFAVNAQFELDLMQLGFAIPERNLADPRLEGIVLQTKFFQRARCNRRLVSTS
jgi:hypothetical protein